MARATREALAGGQELQPWDWKSSITETGWRGVVEGEEAEEGGGVEGSFSFWRGAEEERKGLKTLWMKALIVDDFGDFFWKMVFVI